MDALNKINKPFLDAIHNKYKSQSEFSRAIGWDKWKVSRILHYKRDVKISDINDISKVLQLPIETAISFFV